MIFCRMIRAGAALGTLTLALMLSLTAPFGGAVRAQQSLTAPLVEVVVAPGDTLRGLSETYLNDPDLWPRILEINDIASVADIRPGVALRLPVEQVAAADGALATALGAIQEATAEGAQLFAPLEIGNAIANHEAAVAARLNGEWSNSVQWSSTATAFATEALGISLAQRDRSAEALLTDIHGSVEGRTPAEAAWSNREISDVLVEFERVRTLSASTAQVTFRDLSRLRLNPNSNATIQTMRSDPLTGRDVTTVNLVEGDFYALLNQIGDRSEFEIEVAGLSTQTNSSDFWVQSADNVARFANYDSEDLVIGDGDGVVALGENQGAIVGADGSAQVTDVLDRAVLNAPEDEAQVFGGSVALAWSGPDSSAGYWLEVARDEGFNEMEISEWGIRETGFTVTGLAPGRYVWRIAALDGFGLPGAWSTARRFDVIADTTPPFLALGRPQNGARLTEAVIEVAGETEPGAALTLNGSAVPVSATGGFMQPVTLAEGVNTITLQAADAVGNVTQRMLEVTYRPDEEASLTLDPDLPRGDDGTILTQTADLALRATTDAAPGAPVRLSDPSGLPVGAAVVADGGRITLSVPATDSRTDYVLEVLSPAGAVEGQRRFTVLRDATPPDVLFDTTPPQASALSVVPVTGAAPDADSLRLGDDPVPLGADGAFAIDLPLGPGRNVFDLVARDRVGNVTLRQISIVQDREAPVIARATVVSDDGLITVTAEARDNLGLRPVAGFELELDGEVTAGVLRCDPATALCQATLPDRGVTPRLIAVEVFDYAGNTARFAPTD